MVSNTMSWESRSQVQIPGFGQNSNIGSNPELSEKYNLAYNAVQNSWR